MVRNATCVGGNGMAIGSLGQYLEDSSVANVRMSGVRIVRYNNDMETSAYIKTWVGKLVPQSSYESAGQPRGGGWGSVQNIRFENFQVEGADVGPAITQDSGDFKNETYDGTSLLEVSNVAFVNFTGYTNTNRAASVSCSAVKPCFGITVEGLDLTVNDTGVMGAERCKFIRPGGVYGLNGTGCT